mmetsp:Transcript_46720/g.117652  ORF Transcript_46720/g.117652 Transcript_46720/m.117652 type:complete len:285 (-) Transcript_46720:74-928(-)
MNITYLRSIGLNVMHGESSSLAECVEDCPTTQVCPPVESKTAAKPSKKGAHQTSKGAAKQADEGNAKETRAAAKAAKQREKDVSQTLSMLLRHRAREVGVHIDGAGWVAVQDALAWMNSFEGDDAIEGPPVTEEEVSAVVSASDKQRFELRDGTPTRIRASQGHSMTGIDLDLQPLTGADVPVAVHGTYYTAWEMIQQDGLKRRERNHIHFAHDLPGASGVISGMRSSCEVLIWVDVRKSEMAGMTFYRSANGVILTEGINGVIAPHFFSRVVDRKSGAALEGR